jgi:hypothetical protein
MAADLGFALPRAPVRKLRRAFTEDERRAIAKAIVEHLKLCGWRFTSLSQPWGMGLGRAVSNVGPVRIR